MNTLPRDIHVGMKVFDSHHNAIGEVEDFKFSENEEQPDVEPAELDEADRDDRPDTILGVIADAFGSENLPQALRARLAREGYIRLNTKGLLTKDRFILPSQIESSSDDEILLNVDEDELVERP
jgi:hypothetical protein